MKLATIEQVLEVKNHPNADKLDIIKVLGYDAIVGRDSYKVGDIVIFIQPDSILPHDQAWAQEFLRYTSRGRLRAIRLRGEWSMGLVLSEKTFNSILDNVLEEGDFSDYIANAEAEGFGNDVTDLLGVTKYEPALPTNLQAKGGLPFNIPRTDEERWQNIRDLESLFGTEVDITLKIDGQSGTYYCVLPEHNPGGNSEPVVGLCSRSLELKNDEESTSNWHTAERRYNILEKLKNYCVEHGVSLALRGEVFGGNIQGFKHNPHAGGEIDFALYSVYVIDARQYARRGSKYYSPDVAEALSIPHVPLIDERVYLDKQSIDYYDHGEKTLFGSSSVVGQKFEGVVVQHASGSFKIINKWYDSEKE